MRHTVMYQLLSMHFKKFFREPSILFWAVAFPIVMSWLLGVAFEKKAEPIRHIGIIRSIDSQGLVAELQSKTEAQKGLVSGRFLFETMTEPEAVLHLKRGEIALYLYTREDGPAGYVFDPKNAEAKQAYLLLEKAWAEQESTREIRPLTSVGNRYIDFLIPGLMAMGILSSCLWGTGWALIDLRMKKMLRRMMATPLQKSTFLISQLMTRVVLSGFEMCLLYGFAHAYFHVTIEGSFGAFALLFLAGNMAFSGIAICMASRANNPVVGNGLINAVMMPMLFLSGIFFSYHNYPNWMIPVIEKLPLTLLADGLRHVMIEGASYAQVVGPVLWLTAIGVAFFALGLKLFKWY